MGAGTYNIQYISYMFDISNIIYILCQPQRVIKNVLHRLWSTWLPGYHYEGIPFVEVDFLAGQNIFNHSETSLIIRSVFCCFVRALRVRAQYIKDCWFFKSCRSRRELSNALVESFWEAVLVEIRPF